ncbi:hypothetical protein N1851_008358 [Merluccius polli]|uniref:Uncharacterized protein n=1 Tax=Merluccius polli TaxID=89951 RepID=A0AA47N2P1_MERPO|nr:hypothetical protein N1851_008358 [Merluccius polli]
MEEIGNEMMIEEDIVVGTSHFDQQSFRMDLPEEESESDQDADETDQACNLGQMNPLPKNKMKNITRAQTLSKG